MATVLLVEDCESAVALIEYVLTKEGITVLTARKLSEAELFLPKIAEIDLIIWDAQLTDGYSFSLIEKFRKVFSSPMIANSSSKDSRKVQLKAGCDYECYEDFDITCDLIKRLLNV